MYLSGSTTAAAALPPADSSICLLLCPAPDRPTRIRKQIVWQLVIVWEEIRKCDNEGTAAVHLAMSRTQNRYTHRNSHVAWSSPNTRLSSSAKCLQSMASSGVLVPLIAVVSVMMMIFLGREFCKLLSAIG